MREWEGNRKFKFKKEKGIVKSFEACLPLSVELVDWQLHS